jgi:hypothetical protein
VKTLPEIFSVSIMNKLDHCYLEALSEALKGNLGEALELRNEADALASEGFSFSEDYGSKYPFIEEAVNTLLDSYEFTRCVRADGSAYGTRGKCKKGTEEAMSTDDLKRELGTTRSSARKDKLVEEIVRRAPDELKALSRMGGLRGKDLKDAVTLHKSIVEKVKEKHKGSGHNTKWFRNDLAEALGKGGALNSTLLNKFIRDEREEKKEQRAKPEQATSPTRRTRAERDTAAKATLKRIAAKGPDTSVRKQGDRIVVSRGSEFKAVLHPEHQIALGKLKEGERFKFEDESGTHWSATRSGNSIRLEGGDTRHGSKPYKMSMGRDKLM